MAVLQDCYCTVCYGAALVPYTNPGYYSCPYPGSNYTSGSSCYKRETLAATYNPPFVSYEPRLRLERSVAGTVTPIKTIVIPSASKSIKVSTSGDNINVYSYSSPNAVTQTGYLGHAAAGATKTSYVGIVKATVASSQGTAVDNIKVE